jgi:hypothetical protein
LFEVSEISQYAYVFQIVAGSRNGYANPRNWSTSAEGSESVILKRWILLIGAVIGVESADTAMSQSSNAAAESITIQGVLPEGGFVCPLLI